MVRCCRSSRGFEATNAISLHVDYKDSQASLPIRVYVNSLYELFYDTDSHSRVSFHTRVICCDAPIEGLNLLYRIMRDHWSPCSAPA